MATTPPVKGYQFSTIGVQGGGQYVLVKERIKYLNDEYGRARYESRATYDFFPELKMFVVKTTLTIYDADGNNPRVFEGLAQEIVSIKGVNATSALENCHTSSFGRACAMAGIGIEQSIASAEEMQKTEALREVRIGQAVEHEVSREQHKADFVKRLDAVATPEVLTEMAREGQDEPDEEMKSFKLAAIKLAAKSLGYKSVKNVGFVNADSTGADESKAKGGAATQAVLDKLK
jgi:hypothetical protein